MAEKFTRYDTAEYLKTDTDMAEYLDACLEEAGDDPAFIAHALGVKELDRSAPLASSLKQLAGGWTQEEADAFLLSTKPCEQIDEDMWK